MFTRTEKEARKPNAEDVRKKAYELFEKRGKEPGHEIDDWLKAERILMTSQTTVINKVKK